jgi:hypothetical protein
MTRTAHRRTLVQHTQPGMSPLTRFCDAAPKSTITVETKTFNNHLGFERFYQQHQMRRLWSCQKGAFGTGAGIAAVPALCTAAVLAAFARMCSAAPLGSATQILEQPFGEPKPVYLNEGSRAR